MAILYSAAAGSTGNTVYLLASDETTGAPVTTLVWNTASFTINYVLTRGLPQSIPLATLATADAVWASGGFVVVLGNLYRLDVPDAAFTASGRIIILPQLAGVFFSPVQAITPAFDPLAAGDTAASIADAVLDEALSGHVAAGSLGKAVADVETDATATLAAVDTEVAAILAEVDTEVGAIKAQTDQLVFAGARVNANSDVSAAVVADAVLDELLAAHVTAGTLGKALGDILDANQLKFSYAAGTGILTVFKADGVTTLFTRTLTLAARDAIQAAT